MKAIAAAVVMVLAVAVMAESAVERPAPGAKLVRPVIFGSRSQSVNIVPRGDPRARGPTAPVASVSNGLSMNAPFNGGRGSIAAPTDVLARADDIAAVKSKARRFGMFGANFGKNRCIAQGGQCQLANTCAGLVTNGLCPGPSYIKCCTYTSTKCAAIGGSCKDTSTCTGEVTRNLCPGGTNIACCTEKAGTSTTPARAQGGNCLANFNGPALATRALAYQSAYTNNGVRFDEKRRQFGPAPITYSDSSAFVTSVLDSLGWNCLFAVGRSVAVMNSQITARGGFHSSPRTGDLAMWSDHAAIVIGGTSECTTTGGGVRIVSMTESGVIATECIAVDSMKTFGSGTFNGFYTPH